MLDRIYLACKDMLSGYYLVSMIFSLNGFGLSLTDTVNAICSNQNISSCERTIRKVHRHFVVVLFDSDAILAVLDRDPCEKPLAEALSVGPEHLARIISYSNLPRTAGRVHRKLHS
jgi:hypothetical protein